MSIKCCCVCGKLQKNGEWINMWVIEPSLFMVSHGYCPKHIAEVKKSLKKIFRKGK